MKSREDLEESLEIFRKILLEFPEVEYSFSHLLVAELFELGGETVSFRVTLVPENLQLGDIGGRDLVVQGILSLAENGRELATEQEKGRK